MTNEEFVDAAISLFDNHKDEFGICDHDAPGAGIADSQVEFEDKFDHLICELRGHEIVTIEGGSFCRRCYELDVRTAEQVTT